MDRPQLSTSPDAPLAFVDIETTGGHSGVHRIIDVAVVGVTGTRLDFEWQSLVNPGVHVPAGITELTGIDNDMLVDAPPFEKIAAELRARLAGRLFVAHNVRFDYGFIRREFARMGIEWRSPNMCTVRLSRALHPEMPRHNLDAVIERHGIQLEQRHRAMPDAQAIWQFWRRSCEAWPHATLCEAMDLAALRATLPAALPPDLADDLPEEPGVYRFYGVDPAAQGELLLYVGKANNLRERVLDHFRAGASDARSQRLAAQVRRVDWTETPGTLGALLLEAREVRECHPVYNRQARGDGARFTWVLDESGDAPRVMELDADLLRAGHAFGVYRTGRDAQRALEGLARAHKWCFKLLGLEQGPGSCVGLQMGRCNGVCTGKESAALHLARVRIGLLPLRLKQWPHAGPMVLREGAGARQHLHVIDAWQHLATFDADDAETGLMDYCRGSRRRSEASFDIDGYRILTRALRDRRLTPLPKAPDESWS